MDAIKFSPEELHSMALWDAWCEAMPITALERQECAERDAYCRTTNFTTPHAKPITEEQRKRNREYAARYRAKNKDKISAYYAHHSTERIEYQREYRKFKS